VERLDSPVNMDHFGCSVRQVERRTFNCVIIAFITVSERRRLLWQRDGDWSSEIHVNTNETCEWRRRRRGGRGRWVLWHTSTPSKRTPTIHFTSLSVWRPSLTTYTGWHSKSVAASHPSQRWPDGTSVEWCVTTYKYKWNL